MQSSNKMQIEMVSISDLKSFKRRIRIHNKLKHNKLKANISAVGIPMPICIDRHNRIVDGEALVRAAEELGYESVPAIRISHLTDGQIRMLRISLNKLSEGSDWDKEALGLELQDIMIEGPDIDLTVTGFEAPQIDNLLGFKVEGTGELDAPVDPDTIAEPISRLGDLWIIGDHKLCCGDATLKEAYAALMGEDRARMVLTDPPYNVKIQGNVSGLGKAKHREFVAASGEMSESAFAMFLFAFIMASKRHVLDGALFYMFMDAKHLKELELAAHCAYLETLNICSWVKTNAGMGSMYRSQQEFVLVSKAASKKSIPHVNNVQLGAHGRYRTTVWNYAGVNRFGKGREEALAMHPTVKPTDMLADAILDASHKGDIILDPFGGSGSTMVAAEHVGRRARVMELDPLYVDTIILRMTRTFGLDAIHADTGLTFDELAKQRASSSEEAADG